MGSTSHIGRDHMAADNGDGIAVEGRLNPEVDGSVRGTLSVGSSDGRPVVEAGITFRRRHGWHYFPEDPSITINPESGRKRIAVPRFRWALPKVTINPDGSVTVRFSLLNRGDVDLNASVRLRHGDGWSFVADTPELTLGAGTGQTRVSSTFRAPTGRSVGSGDTVTVHLSINGVPVAEVRASAHRAPALRQTRVLTAALLLAAVPLVGGIAIADRSNDDTTTTTTVPNATSVPGSPTTSAPNPRPPGAPVPGPVPDGPGPTPDQPPAGLSLPVVEPAVVDFGSFPHDYRREVNRTVRMRNRGTAPFTVTGVTARAGREDAFAYDPSGCVNVTLAPGHSCPIEVTFRTGHDPGPYARVLVIQHDLPGSLQAELRATVADPPPPPSTTTTSYVTRDPNGGIR